MLRWMCLVWLLINCIAIPLIRRNPEFVRKENKNDEKLKVVEDYVRRRSTAKTLEERASIGAPPTISIKNPKDLITLSQGIRMK